MLVISGIFLFTSRDIGYLGLIIKGIFYNLLKGIRDTPVYFQGYRILVTPYTSLINYTVKHKSENFRYDRHTCFSFISFW